MKGKFITFEGSEGSGKSTQISLISKYLKQQGKKILFVREPGGVKISESIRSLLLNVKNTQMSSECETLLYMAARAQLIEEVIAPALKKGYIVLSDRFLDSTIAYQGYGNGIDIKTIKTIGSFATLGIVPDLTFLFDIETKKGLSRTNRVKDRIELRSLAYHNRVRKGYLSLARQEPKRIKVIKVNAAKETIHLQVRAFINTLLKIDVNENNRKRS